MPGNAGDTRRRLQVHLSVEQYERWQGAAESAGTSLAEFVRTAVENRIRGRDPDRMTDRFADRVLRDLLPELERVLLERAAVANPMSLSEPPQTLAFVPPEPISKPWDPACYSAEFQHRLDEVCNECGGSYPVKVK